MARCVMEMLSSPGLPTQWFCTPPFECRESQMQPTHDWLTKKNPKKSNLKCRHTLLGVLWRYIATKWTDYITAVYEKCNPLLSPPPQKKKKIILIRNKSLDFVQSIKFYSCISNTTMLCILLAVVIRLKGDAKIQKMHLKETTKLRPQQCWKPKSSAC